MHAADAAVQAAVREAVPALGRRDLGEAVQVVVRQIQPPKQHLPPPPPPITHTRRIRRTAGGRPAGRPAGRLGLETHNTHSR